MKKGKHPEYQTVVFVDSTTNSQFVCGAAMSSKETIQHEGESLPMVRVGITSCSHPFFTGKRGLVDAEGRVDKFQRRYAAAIEKRQKPTDKDA